MQTRGDLHLKLLCVLEKQTVLADNLAFFSVDLPVIKILFMARSFKEYFGFPSIEVCSFLPRVTAIERSC